jgi:hypothetical protein
VIPNEVEKIILSNKKSGRWISFSVAKFVEIQHAARLRFVNKYLVNNHMGGPA